MHGLSYILVDTPQLRNQWEMCPATLWKWCHLVVLSGPPVNGHLNLTALKYIMKHTVVRVLVFLREVPAIDWMYWKSFNWTVVGDCVFSRQGLLWALPVQSHGGHLHPVSHVARGLPRILPHLPHWNCGHTGRTCGEPSLVNAHTQAHACMSFISIGQVFVSDLACEMSCGCIKNGNSLNMMHCTTQLNDFLLSKWLG